MYNNLATEKTHKPYPLVFTTYNQTPLSMLWQLSPYLQSKCRIPLLFLVRAPIVFHTPSSHSEYHHKIFSTFCIPVII